jgi:hypothetical protein
MANSSALCGVVALIATALLPEPGRAAVAREFEQGAAAPVPRPVTAALTTTRKVAVPTR